MNGDVGGIFEELAAVAAAYEAEDDVEGRLLEDFVVLQRRLWLGSELFAGEDDALLVGWYAIFFFDLLSDHVDLFVFGDFEGDGLATEDLHEDLHCFAGYMRSVPSAKESFGC